MTKWTQRELELLALARVPAPAAGVPVLRGPYVVNFSDVPHDDNSLTLWTPQAGDIVVWVGCDVSTLTAWDAGQLNIDQHGNNGIASVTAEGFSIATLPILLTPDVALEASWHTTGSEATMGHLELYVLVSRALAP